MKKKPERLYETDDYLREFQATVLSCEKASEDAFFVVLDKTAFYPEGGGQTGDCGWLKPQAADEEEHLPTIAVTDTVERDGILCHKTAQPMEPGSVVTGTIDFERRFDKMQQHTGEHILSGIVHRLYGYDNVGFHLGEELTTMDFSGELSAEQLRDLEVRANQAIYENHEIKVSYPTKEELENLKYRSKIEIEGQVRLVEIEGVDCCACCAPHVKTTAEVGIIKILNCDRHRGGCRLTIVCGMRGLEDYQKKQESVKRISEALSAKPEKVFEAVEHLQEQQRALREQLNRVQELYLSGEIEKIREEDACVCIFVEGIDHIAVRNFVNQAAERCHGICCAFLGNDTEGYHYILGSKTADVRETAKKLNEAFQGKGGGKPQMVQGSVFGKREDIEALMKGIQ